MSGFIIADGLGNISSAASARRLLKGGGGEEEAEEEREGALAKQRTQETNGPIISWGPPWENGWAKRKQCGKPGSGKNAGQGGLS